MPESEELSKARDEALRKIGRNVLNLQKMEGMLKHLLVMLSGDSVIGDLNAVLDSKKRDLHRKPMGKLAKEFLRTIHSEPLSEDTAVTEVSEPSFSWSFTMNSDGSVLKQRRKALAEIVAERNSLIHKMLADFDPNTVANCRELSRVLDEQHEKILPEIESLAAMIRDVREELADLKAYVDSDQFITDMKEAQANPNYFPAEKMGSE